MLMLAHRCTQSHQCCCRYTNAPRESMSEPQRTIHVIPMMRKCRDNENPCLHMQLMKAIPPSYCHTNPPKEPITMKSLQRCCWHINAPKGSMSPLRKTIYVIPLMRKYKAGPENSYLQMQLINLTPGTCQHTETTYGGF